MKLTRIKIVIIISFVVLSVITLYYGGVMRESEHIDNLEDDWQPQMVPDLSMQTLDGRSFKLSDYRGKVVLLNFWASWCQPCITEFPSMLKLIDREQGQIIMIAVSQDDGRSDIDRFLQRHASALGNYRQNSNLVMVWDSQKMIGPHHFSVLRIPETFVIDKRGRMVRKIVGAVEWAGPDMQVFFDDLIQAKVEHKQDQ